MTSSTASPILTATKKGTAYLEIVPHGTKIRVQRTDSGRTLNRFWTAQLRQLLLEQTSPKHGFAVELRGSSILVSSNTSQQGLMETVRMLASRITPVPNPPMTRRDSTISNRYMSWFVDDGVDLTDCLSTLRLPRAGVTGGLWHISLDRSQRCLFRIGELALMVESHVATTWVPEAPASV